LDYFILKYQVVKRCKKKKCLFVFIFNKKLLTLSFKHENKIGLYHARKNNYADGLANYYNLVNGIDMLRFNTYKMKGVN
jgi:hypothetical protein